MIQNIIKFQYDVRWVVEYFDGIKSEVGFWSRDNVDKIETMISFKRNKNILKAYIEARNRTTFETKRIAHCTGDDYCFFKWVYGGRVGFNSKGKTGFNVIKPEILGLTLVTRYVECTVYRDKILPHIVERTKEDMNYNYASYGR